LCAFDYLKIFINFNRLGKRRRIGINFSIKKIYAKGFVLIEHYRSRKISEFQDELWLI